MVTPAALQISASDDFSMALVEICDVSFDFRAIVRESEYSYDPYYDPLYGDVDGDGTITIIDATLVQRADVKMKLLSAFQQELADVDSDGEVSVLDTTFIQRYLVDILSDRNRTGEPYYTW